MNRMLQEARLFASISNPHIIRYNHSWIEVADCPLQSQETEPEAVEKPLETSVELESPFIEFDGVSVKDSGRNESVKSKKREESYTHAEKKMLKISLYIQMELCRETLEDYLNVRTYPLTQLERDKALDIARQLIDAIWAIHDEYKIIHRDLSLRNIFIGNDDVIKIGDFGLATKCPHIIPVMPSPFPFKPIAPQEDPDVFSLDGSGLEDVQLPPAIDEFLEEDEMETEEKELTHGLGTKTFSAPEQMADSPYDQKADIYSLGLILLVLLYPTKTLSERFEVLQQCRKSMLPKEFTEQYPEIAAVISRMVSEKPSVRPTAGELQKLHLFEPKQKQMNNEWEKLNINETKCTIKLGATGKPKTKYLKILGDSLLLYNKKTDMKAKLCYPLKECRINSSEVGGDQAQEIKHNKSVCDSSENSTAASCFRIVIEHPQLESLHVLLTNLPLCLLYTSPSPRD
eukprot:TRINITY_DN2914_c0_g2_i5.p1 TRINITY_DN2914_c0_g2~~TRINITY_DN2914_c0_g2_i5.p1  ORF type:complete len:458 (-),score=107.05 TRINITY_DN2914_c0_g2_i5:57-1430(-)